MDSRRPSGHSAHQVTAGHPPARFFLIDTIFENHVFRKLYHTFGGGLILGLLVLLDRNWFLIVGIIYFAAFLIFGRRISFAMVGILLVLILSGSKFTTLLTMVIWVVGDGLAGLIGKAYGRRRWPWQPQKTLAGSISFFAGATVAAWLLLLAYLDLPLSSQCLLAVLPSLVASTVEMLPITFIRDRKPDDNLTVLLATGVAVHGLTAWLGVAVGT